MSFQWIFDYAETISINKRAVVAQSITRGNRVKSVKIGGQTWRFDVKLPDGMRWSDIRTNVAAHEALDLYTEDTIYLNNTGYSYINNYQGDASPGNIQLTYNSDLAPTTLNMHSVSSLTEDQFIFKKGDWLQLGNQGHAYTVVNDVPRGNVDIANVSVTVNRPVIETANVSQVYTVTVGQNVGFDVICVAMPNWTLFGYDQVQWDGVFTFYEVV
jgi:hypothetical protein